MNNDDKRRNPSGWHINDKMHVHVLSDGLTRITFDSDSNSEHFDADELREAAHLFNQVAEYLDGQPATKHEPFRITGTLAMSDLTTVIGPKGMYSGIGPATEEQLRTIGCDDETIKRLLS